MITVSSVCTNLQLLSFINILKKLINLGTFIVPVILTIFIIIDIIKNISSSEIDNKKISKSIFKRLSAAIIVFLVPIIINLILYNIPMNTLYYVDCYNNASTENINYIAENNALQAMNKLNETILNRNYNEGYLAYEEARISIRNIPNKNIRESYKNSLDISKKQLDSLKENNSITIETSEGNYQTESSIIVENNQQTESSIVENNKQNYKVESFATKYNYNYIEKNLKKYKNLSTDRKNIVLKAASYAGKIPYYWGGTASSKNFNSNNFGSTINADISGRTKKGLDCSHFVDFVFWQVMNDNLGNSNTVYIWNNKSTSISEKDLLPGDIGFQNNYDDPKVKENHVGIFAGTDDDGNKIWIHLAGNPNNNVVINNRKLTYYRRINILH